jgi:hypothetical protein
MVKILIIDVLARTGAYLCNKAIKLAGNGSIEFEVFTHDYSASLMYRLFDQPKKSLIEKSIAFGMASIFVGSVTWVGLMISISVMNNLS